MKISIQIDIADGDVAKLVQTIAKTELAGSVAVDLDAKPEGIAPIPEDKTDDGGTSKGKRGRPKKEKDAEPEADMFAEAESAPEAKDEKATEEKAPSKEDLLKEAERFMKENGTAALVEILKEMGISRLRETPDDKVAELIARLSVL